jgi:DNA-binding NarL/FixJ family response regulator
LGAREVGSLGMRNESTFPAMPAERTVARLLREAVDLDAERGLAILGADRRALYSNAAARTLLRDGTERGLDPLLPQSVDQAVEALLVSVRMQRAPLVVEVYYPSEVERRVRVDIEAVWHDLGLHVILRATPATPWTEPTVRRLQTRFGLTLREAQVAVGVARGQSNSEVAAGLGIVEKTVKNVLMAVYQKCEVRNRVELALRAYDAPVTGGDSRS